MTMKCECEKCGNRPSQLHSVGDGPRLCPTCFENAEREKQELKDAPFLAARAAHIEESRRLLDEIDKAAEDRPKDPIWCTHNPQHVDSPYRTGKPAVGINSRGEACCAECLPPELNPQRLHERIAALEAALAAPAAKSTRKASS
jgi:hypothetical protein